MTSLLDGSAFSYITCRPQPTVSGHGLSYHVAILTPIKRRAMFFDYNGIIGLIILILDIWAIINIVKSSAPDTNKILWVVIVILLPVIGLILWFLMGPGKKRGTSV